MSDMGDAFRDQQAWDKERRRRNLKNADPTGWTVHNAYHWSRDLNGHRLDYWPTRCHFRWKGRSYHGNVEGFIKNREVDNA